MVERIDESLGVSLLLLLWGSVPSGLCRDLHFLSELFKRLVKAFFLEVVRDDIPHSLFLSFHLNYKWRGSFRQGPNR